MKCLVLTDLVNVILGAAKLNEENILSIVSKIQWM